MHLPLSHSALLAGVLTILTVQVVDSLPLVILPPKMITMPLKRIEQARNEHGLIYLQLHINRSVRRLARLTSRQEPTDDELLSRLERRVLSIENLEGSERRALEKRYSRSVIPKSAAVNPGIRTSGPPNNGKKTPGGKKAPGQRKPPPPGAHPPGAGKPLAAGNSTQPDGGPDGSTPPGDGGNTTNTTNTGGNVVNGVTLANQPTADNSLGLNIEAHDAGYLATIQMGTPPRDFTILVDSGSSDLWVGAENCQADTGGNCGNHTFLGPQSSSSFVDTKAPFQITYGTGKVSGDVITDNLSLGTLNLPGHTFGVATTESVEFFSDSVVFDGIMGLAPSTGSQQKVLTPVEALAKANLIPEPIVSYKISRIADNLNDGEVTFGGLDSTKFDAQTLVTLPNVNTRGLWEADLDAVSVNGNDVGLSNRTAILDTGTTLLAIPLDDATKIHALINGSNTDGQGGFSVPCTLTDKVALQFGGHSFEIDPRDVAFAPLDPANPEGDCLSGIIATSITGIGDTQWLVGDVFLKNAYFSTDVAKNTLSLAELV